MIVSAADLPAGAPLLLDTDVVSYLTSERDTRGALYRPRLQGRLLAISFMTLAELHQGADLKKWSKARRLRLAADVARYTVIQSTPGICQRWARLRAEASAEGRTIPPSDAWIAATALVYRLPLVTHNVRHFATVPALTIVTECR